MTTRIVSVALVSLFVQACGGSSSGTESPAGTGESPLAAERALESGADTVRVDESMQRDLRVTYEEVESRTGGELISLLGELAVNERAYAEVGVPIASRVTRLLASPGQTVRQGDPLAELTSPELGQARADYLSAAARVELAEAALDRKRDLASERIAPLREVQEAESEAAAARAALRAARAVIGAFGVEPPADDRPDSTSSLFTLRSPIAGSVLERHAVLGQMLDPSAPAFHVGNLSSLWLTVQAFERDAVRVQNGITARVAFAALPGRDFEGQVSMVGQQVDSGSRTVPVRIELSNEEGLLRPGMSATAVLPVGESGDRILTVPVAAVQRVGDNWCVFLPNDDGTFEIRRIGRGRDLAGEVEVVAGLRANERIVVDGAFLLKAEAERGELDEHAH
jgi:cobalt-zinc-cadmium efflux system membrane fusion protein